MKTADAREAADLAKLLPRLAEHDIPATRQQAIRQHLLAEISTADATARQRIIGVPAHRRVISAAMARSLIRWPGRRVLLLALPAVVAGTAAAVMVSLLTRSAPAINPAAVRLLDKIAAAASREPAPAVRPSQFVYQENWGANEVCDVGRGKCVLAKPSKVLTWQSVSDQCITGLERSGGRDMPLSILPTVNGKPQKHALGMNIRCPDRGGLNAPTYWLLKSLPTDPHALLNVIYAGTKGEGQALGPDGEAFTTIGDMLGNAPAPPKVTAALYRAAALIPGVSVVPDATDALGRPGVAVAYTRLGIRTEWVFSKATLQYLGYRETVVSSGAPDGANAVVRRAFVNHVGELP